MEDRKLVSLSESQIDLIKMAIMEKVDMLYDKSQMFVGCGSYASFPVSDDMPMIEKFEEILETLG
jgi:hypothetical protein